VPIAEVTGYHSIILSARASTVGATSMPSSFAVFQVDYKLEYGGNVRLAAYLPSLLSEYDQRNGQAAADTGHSNFAALRICHYWMSF